MRNRFREAREERRFSAVALAEKLGIHPSTLTNWEAGRRQITPDKLVELADILGFTIDYLLARESPQVSLIEPVDKKALRAMHGQPVWAAAHGWMLVNIVENAFVLKNLRLIPFDEVQEPIYFIPPALSLSMRGVGEPLRLDDVLSGDRFWVEPITADNDLAAELRGWYSIYEKRLAQNEFGNRFYIDTYGAKWLAFRDCIKEKENWERLSVMDKNIYDTIETMVSIGKGWSEDKKYCITTADGIKYLLRISPLSQYETKKILFSTTEQIAAMGIPMCVPIEFGICDDGVYTIQSWIDGEDLKPVLSTLSETEQYALGIQAGKILKKIHSILVPEEQDGWAVKYNLEIDAKIKAYRDCSLHFDGDDYVLAYIEHNRHLLKNRPQCYLVWDYNIMNMMYENSEVKIIDFEYYNTGDPWNEFCCIVWSAVTSPHFATGQIRGYFGGKPPEEFFELMVLYNAVLLLSLLSSSWATTDAGRDASMGLSQNILKWHGNMKNPVPTWYLQDFHVEYTLNN